MNLKEQAIAFELRKYLLEYGTAIVDSTVQELMDTRIKQLDDENKNLANLFRHLIYVITNDNRLSDEAKELTGGYLLQFATIIHNADDKPDDISSN